MESTYGDRDHKSYEATLEEFESIITEAQKTGGKMIIPTFAIGRAQQIIYHLAEMFHNKKVKPFPVYLDSPMALKALDVYGNHQDLLDEEFQELIAEAKLDANSDIDFTNFKIIMNCFEEEEEQLNMNRRASLMRRMSRDIRGALDFAKTVVKD